MRCFSTNKVSYYSLILGLLLLLHLLKSCTGKSNSDIQTIENRQFHTINLFSTENAIYDNTGKLSLDEAFQISKEVLHVTSIEKINSSQNRGVKPFYIYKILEGTYKKPVDAKRNKLPILFLSEHELFQEKILKDSVHVFLEPLQQFELLRKNVDVKYKWVSNAPFIKQ